MELVISFHLTRSYFFLHPPLQTVWSETDLNFCTIRNCFKFRSNQRNWRQTSQNKVNTEEAWVKKDHFKDLNARSNQILKRPKNTHIIPTAKWKRSKLAPKHILRRPELIWNQKFVPTQQLWQSTRPNAAPSPPHPHYTADSPPGCGVGCYLLVVVVGFFVLFFPFPHSHSSLPQLNPFFLLFPEQCFLHLPLPFCFIFALNFHPPSFFIFYFMQHLELVPETVTSVRVQLCAWRGPQKLLVHQNPERYKTQGDQ